ncbi:hypothetical protein [Nonomuraea sp. B19D2]|uniref:hypothetical protein n=1 Tax=Nonomuraea sp. B19D2 TaxID=3159561 RepID=UPI0032DA39C3
MNQHRHAAGRHRDFVETPDGGYATSEVGLAVLENPLLNKDTAFSPEERASLALDGLIPPVVETLEEQAGRAYAQYGHQPTDLAKNVFLSALQDCNEVLFYRLLGDHLREMLPIVYDPTVAQAIKSYSREYRRPRGVYRDVGQCSRL